MSFGADEVVLINNMVLGPSAYEPDRAMRMREEPSPREKGKLLLLFCVKVVICKPKPSTLEKRLEMSVYIDMVVVKPRIPRSIRLRLL